MGYKEQRMKMKEKKERNIIVLLPTKAVTTAHHLHHEYGKMYKKNEKFFTPNVIL